MVGEVIRMKDGNAYGGVFFTDPEPGIEHVIVFTEKEVDLMVPADFMFGKVNGVVVKIDFAVEYTGEEFTIIVNDKEYKGVFKENMDFSKPTILEEK